jgi:hypothetical protein
LVDLTSGKDRNTGVAIDLSAGYTDGTSVWSPDSGWLFAVANGQKLVAIDAASAKSTDLGVAGNLTQIALRTASG